jgi:hypothetical protein
LPRPFGLTSIFPSSPSHQTPGCAAALSPAQKGACPQRHSGYQPRNTPKTRKALSPSDVGFRVVRVFRGPSSLALHPSASCLCRTFRLTDAGPMMSDCQLRRDPGVRCSRFGFNGSSIRGSNVYHHNGFDRIIRPIRYGVATDNFNLTSPMSLVQICIISLGMRIRSQ